ncbi:MAG TPA: DoxX family membrane protein [Candidatus Paceibacterota bacterium]
MNNKIYGKGTNIALLIARIIIGGMFMFAGWLKVADISGTIAMFDAMNVHPVLTLLVSYGEMLLGLLLMAGLWTRLIAPLMMIIMAGAVYYSYAGGPAMYAIPAVFFVALAIIAKCGAGKYRIKSSYLN